ncbi:endonuclease/exonuclease/phosphatase family protein [Compostibacter hankyongensis]|uniref:Endonuclease/exonuclease/phosphatase domain-containing protein n=1 Tax=Compostibacter hankyongensis TaxID=1007089 RepID=A0ABP8FJ22_9BACT
MKKQPLILVLALLLAAAKLPAQQLKVLTYNIHHAEDNAGKVNTENIAKVIRDFGPDLVALQELDSMTDRTGKVFQLQQIARESGIPYFYFARAMDYQGGGYGIGVLSRYPLESSATHHLPSVTGGEPRAIAEITVRLKDGTRLKFASTHLDYRKAPEERLRQIQTLLGFYRQDTLPVILAGDMNSRPDSKEIALMKTRFSDASASSGYTIPWDDPHSKIDYILTDKSHTWTTGAIRVLKGNPASDHCPVFAVLQLQP